MIDLSDVEFRRVILVPLPQIDSYRYVLELARILENVHKASVKVCNYSIYPSGTFPINRSITDEEYAIQEIVEHARSVQDINWGNFLSDEEHLLRTDQYERWLQKIYLYNSSEPQKNIAPLSYSDLSSVPSYDNSTNDLHDILSPGTVSFCYGTSTAGKSIWALTLALSFSCGFNVFKFSSIKKNKILYIDYETSSGRFKYNLEQLIDAYGIDKTILDKNFKFMLKTVDPDIQHIWDNKQSTSLFHNICDNIKKDGVKLVIIDTLTRVAPNSPQSSSQAAAFIEYMIDVSTQLDLAILILHHANKDGDMKGSSDLFNGATNVFQLEKVKQSSEGSGANLKVTYSKVKTAPHLENRYTHYRLQFKNNNKVHPWEEYNPEESEARNSLSIGAHVTWNMNLYTTEQNKFIGILAKSHNPLSLKEIKALSNGTMTERIYQTRIKEINERSSTLQIIRVGAGPTTTYKLEIRTDGGQPKPAAS